MQIYRRESYTPTVLKHNLTAVRQSQTLCGIQEMNYSALTRVS